MSSRLASHAAWSARRAIPLGCAWTLTTLAGGALAQQPAKRAMTLDDGFRIVGIGGAQISPDGKWALFSTSTRDFDKDSTRTRWMLASTDGAVKPFQFLSGDQDGTLMWAPDSKAVYFLRPVNRVRQLHQIQISGGEAIALSDLKENEGQWAIAPTGTFFVIRRAEKDSVQEKKKKDGWDHVYVNEGSNGQGAESWSNLWRYDLGTKELTRLTQRDWTVGALDVADNGSRVVFAARPDNLRNTGFASELYVLDFASKEITRLTNNKGPESNPRWLPDGKHIVFHAVSLDGWEAGNGDLWLMDVATREIRNLTGSRGGSTGAPNFSPDGKWMYFAGGWGTARWPRRLEIATGKAEDIATSKGLMAVSSWSDDRQTYLYTYQDFDTPPDLYVGRVGNSSDHQQRLTDLNPWVTRDIALGHAQTAQWKSVKDFTIEGLLFTPAGYDAAHPKPIPLVVNVHGGPAGAWTNSFSVINHVYNGLGYALLAPNVRGSSGYDDKLMRGNVRDIGGGDYQDLMTGADAMIKRGIAHRDSLAVRGWSYGGILGGWTITQTDRFKAASLGAMVSDWTSEYGPGFNYDVSLWYIGGDPWSNAAAWRSKSSLTYVNNVKTPTILFHGDNDNTDTPAQSMNFFAGLQKAGVPSRFIRFPGEPHGFGKMKHQRTRDAEEVTWMQRWLRGMKDYAYPDRPKAADKKVAQAP